MIFLFLFSRNAPLSVVCFIHFFGLCTFTEFCKDARQQHFSPHCVANFLSTKVACEKNWLPLCAFVLGAGTTSQLSCNSLFFYAVLCNVPHFPWDWYCCVQSFGKSRESVMIESASHPTPLPKGGAAS